MVKSYITRDDGCSINVVPQRGQLFVCALGCCCGHVERDFAPVLTDLYHNEWTNRKLRNKVHLTFTACLGPCSIANVALLVIDGQATWFHSLNTEELVLALYDHIEASLKTSQSLPLPAILADRVFSGFTSRAFHT